MDAIDNVLIDDAEEVKALLQDTYFNDNKYEYSDNLRIALAGNPEQVALYKQSHFQGCCGFFDEILITRNRNIYLIGFNYGH